MKVKVTYNIIVKYISYGLFYIILSLIFLSVACKKNQTDYHFSKFPNTVNLTGNPIRINNQFKGCFPNCLDSLLILTSIQGLKKQVLIYNLNTFNYLGNAINLGRGPNEISSIGHIIIDKNKRIIWCQDLVKRSLWRFVIDSILLKEDYFPLYSSKIPDIPALLQLGTYNDSIFSFTGNDPDKLISFFNFQGEIIDTLNIENKINLYQSNELSYETKNFTAYYTYLINEITGRIAIIYKFSDVIVILDKDGNIIKKLFGPGHINQIPDYHSNQIITNSVSICDNDYIFCLYRNNKLFDDTDIRPIFSNEINIYSWDGEPLLKIHCDHTIMTFTIDHENERIITFSPDMDELMSYDFPIKKILSNKK